MPNVLDRQFEADRPNQKWVADFTYIWTAEGWLYVAAVIDLFSRRVVGWSMNASMTAPFVTDALIMAIWRRGKPDALRHHSDQGSQYTSEQMGESRYHCSMSRSGNVWDNAAMESFFSSLKTERTDGRSIGPVTREADACSCIERGRYPAREFENKVGLAQLSVRKTGSRPAGIFWMRSRFDHSSPLRSFLSSGLYSCVA